MHLPARLSLDPTTSSQRPPVETRTFRIRSEGRHSPPMARTLYPAEKNSPKECARGGEDRGLLELHSNRPQDGTQLYRGSRGLLEPGYSGGAGRTHVLRPVVVRESTTHPQEDEATVGGSSHFSKEEPLRKAAPKKKKSNPNIFTPILSMYSMECIHAPL